MHLLALQARSKSASEPPRPSWIPQLWLPVATEQHQHPHQAGWRSSRFQNTVAWASVLAPTRTAVVRRAHSRQLQLALRAPNQGLPRDWRRPTNLESTAHSKSRQSLGRPWEKQPPGPSLQRSLEVLSSRWARDTGCRPVLKVTTAGSAVRGCWEWTQWLSCRLWTRRLRSRYADGRPGAQTPFR